MICEYSIRNRWIPRGARIAAIAGLLAGCAGELFGAEPQPRSLADDRSRPNEQQQYVWPGDRLTSTGPQVRRGPFVILSATPTADTGQIAGQVDEATAAYVRFARHWSEQPAARLAELDAVAVVVHSTADLPRSPGAGVYTDADGTLHLVLAARDHQNPDIAAELRTAVVKHVLRATGQSARLPQSFTDELTRYIVGEGGATADPQAATSRAPSEGIFDSTAASSTSFRYLWEGDDARHAPQLAAALRAATDRSDPSLLEKMLADAELREAQSLWLAEPLADQPRLEIEEGSPPELAQRQREMALLLKLARRFPAVEATQVRPRLTGYADGPVDRGPVELARWEPLRRQRSMRELYRQLTAAGQSWATIDTDGSVLSGSDRSRLDELFAQAENRYELQDPEGQEVLVSRWDTFTRIEAQLEDDTDHPRRPLVRFRFEGAQ